MKFYSIFLLLIFWICNSFTVNSQTQSQKIISGTIDESGDTIPMVYMNFVSIATNRTFKSKEESRYYKRLKYNVKKVYPYAQKAGILMAKYEAKMDSAGIEKARHKKEFYKKVENDLRAEYEEELMKLSITQGRILIKLIDRQTGDTSYELVKSLRGSVSAFFWQSIARIFGNNLKADYDPYEEDELIEGIILGIESGAIAMN